MSVPALVGLHVSSGGLRRAALRRTGACWEVATAIEPRPETREPVLSPTALLAGSENGDPTHYVAALPLSDVLSRFWTFPDADDARFRQMVVHRLEAELPVPLEQLTWGCRRGDAQSAPESRHQVLAQAARTEQVMRHVALLAAAGYRAVTLTTEAEAVRALFQYGLERPGAPGAEVLVLVHDDEWLVGVMTAGLLQALHRIPVAADRLNVSCRQCQQAIERHVARQDVRQVWWCAAPTHDPARVALATQLKLPVTSARPAPHLLTPAGLPLDLTQLATFGEAIGLALAAAFEADQMIVLGDRAPTGTPAQQPWWQRVGTHAGRWSAAAAALFILAIVVHVGSLALESRQMRALLAQAGPDGSPMAPIQPKVHALQRLDTYRVDVEAIIGDICLAVPDSIVVSSLQLSRDRRLVLKGTSQDPKAIYTLADALRGSAWFTAVNPERTEQGQGTGFTISAELVGVQALPSVSGRGAYGRGGV